MTRSFFLFAVDEGLGTKDARGSGTTDRESGDRIAGSMMKGAWSFVPGSWSKVARCEHDAQLFFSLLWSNDLGPRTREDQGRTKDRGQRTMDLQWKRS
jgi:hypothetical protein